MTTDFTPFLRERLDRQAIRLAEIEAALADPASGRDLERLRALHREHAQVSARVGRWQRYQGLERDLVQARQMLAEGGDAEMVELAREEIDAAAAGLAGLSQVLMADLMPRDPDDERNVFLEIRAGTGGEESALFAADLLRMYLRHAERQGWRCEILSAHESDLGGYKEVVVRIEGDAVHAAMKFESGGHRVQRVPATESQGRIHTSACTVAVLPEPDEAAQVTLDPSQLRIDTFRASGAGGQHVNKTDSAVRVTHLPSGLVAECQDDRSQHRNKARALAVLAARLQERERAARAAAEAATRRDLVGSGDRSDRIRTYNFPQGRVTDHRINLTLYQLDAVMEGDVGVLTGPLQAAEAAHRLADLEQGA